MAKIRGTTHWAVSLAALTAMACSGAATDAESAAALAALKTKCATATPVLFDSDMDFDDTVALAYLAQKHKQGCVELRGVTVTNNGAGLPGRGLLHARCLLSRFELSHIPVADGSNEGANEFPGWVRGLIDAIVAEALPDCELTPEPSSLSAAELITAEIAAASRPVMILTTGPVTNVAEALSLVSPAVLKQKLRGVFTMGGAVHVAGELLEPDPRFDGSQEVNYWVDPAGTQRLLDRVPHGRLTMIPHDATNFVPVTFAFLDELAAAASTAEASYVSEMMSHPAVQDGIAAGHPVYWWDPLAAVAMVEKGAPVVEYVWENIDIIEDGPSAGRSLALDTKKAGTRTRVAIWANQERFEKLFLLSLNGG